MRRLHVSASAFLIGCPLAHADGKQNGFSHPQMFALFDLDKDPYELANIYNATVRANPTLTSELHGLLRQFYECRGAECP